MSQFPETRISLILRLSASEDAVAWREFASLYAPAVYSLAKRRGLQTADAEDFVQELLLAVARAAGRWRPDAQRARFRTWLFRVALNLLADHLRDRGRRLAQLDQTVNVDQACEADRCADDAVVGIKEEMEFDLRRAMFHRAAELVKERVSDATWRAFELTAIHSVPPQAVSQQLGLSVGSVYVARSRTMQLLRQEIEKMKSQSEDCSFVRSQEY